MAATDLQEARSIVEFHRFAPMLPYPVGNSFVKVIHVFGKMRTATLPVTIF